MRAAVFDLDGTLVDTAADIRAVANAVLAAEALGPPLTLAETRGFVGAGTAAFVERMLAARTAGPAEPARAARALARFLPLYEDAVHLSRPYPGVGEALARLRAEGWALALCTNKPERPARAVLARFGLTDLFPVVVGGDSLPVRKPDPAPLAHAVAALGADAALLVGDSEVDAATAAAARLPFVLFTEGYRQAPVAELAPAASFADFARLPGLLAGLLAGGG
ncbi:MAG: phosphoglycolate phosphatase [Rhodobacteraceae bacterium]|nr:phosphoglycolate phosphatase [Paracoccaceae bacterium]